MITSVVAASAGLLGVIIGAVLQHFFAARRARKEERAKDSRVAATEMIDQLLELVRYPAIPQSGRSTRARDALESWVADRNHLLDKTEALARRITHDDFRAELYSVNKALHATLNGPLVSGGKEELAEDYELRVHLARHGIRMLTRYLRGDKSPGLGSIIPIGYFAGIDDFI